MFSTFLRRAATRAAPVHKIARPMSIFGIMAQSGRTQVRRSFSTLQTYTSSSPFAGAFRMRRDLTPVQKGAASLAIGVGLFGTAALWTYGKSQTTEHEALLGNLAYFNPEVRARIQSTYAYIVSGLGLTALSAAAMFRSGVALRFAMASPGWALLGSLACTMVPMIGSMMVDHEESPVLKHALWATSMAGMALGLSPITLMGGQLVLKAATGTAMIVGALSAVASAAPSDAFLQNAGMLSVGLGVVAVSGVGTLFFPASNLLYNIALYGGLGVFGAFTLHDTQKVLYRARQPGKYDPINESYSIYLDTINIFVRVAAILGQGNGNRRR